MARLVIWDVTDLWRHRNDNWRKWWGQYNRTPCYNIILFVVSFLDELDQYKEM